MKIAVPYNSGFYQTQTHRKNRTLNFCALPFNKKSTKEKKEIHKSHQPVIRSCDLAKKNSVFSYSFSMGSFKEIQNFGQRFFLNKKIKLVLRF